MADPIEENSCQDLAWHRKEGKPPVVVTLLGVTLSLPDRKDNAPSPVGRDDPRTPYSVCLPLEPMADILRSYTPAPLIMLRRVPLVTPRVQSANSHFFLHFIATHWSSQLLTFLVTFRNKKMQSFRSIEVANRTRKTRFELHCRADERSSS